MEIFIGINTFDKYMNLLKSLLSGSQYFIINKNLVKAIGIDASLILSQLVEFEELEDKITKNQYFTTTIGQIADSTTLSIFKIKSGINNLYKNKIIDIIVNKNETIKVKILHENIFTTLSLNAKSLIKNESKKKAIIKQKRFKKPTLKELKNYFLKIGEVDESEIMFDYYESKGWKVGKAPMKCWKSATRNWIRRLNKSVKFPNHYDKKLDMKLSNDIEELNRYHKHLKKLGWISTYSPSAGITWRKK
ncbi:MAG: hypothetical protein CMP50_05365 [Flavobacteriales bacterium]|nr:hypothetical protein [Flavobacteriales bacterium]